MKLSIKTKFNIGDTVYIAECYEDYWFAYKNPFIVSDILISANSRIMHISYEIQQDNFTHRVPESWAFSTYEECAKWCKKQN